MARLEWPTMFTYVMTTMRLTEGGTSIVELKSHAEETLAATVLLRTLHLLAPGDAKMDGERITDDQAFRARRAQWHQWQRYSGHRSRRARPPQSGDGECSGGIDHGWCEASLTPAMIYLSLKVSARMCSRYSCSFSPGMRLSVRVAAICKSSLKWLFNSRAFRALATNAIFLNIHVL
ncbi:hypothetical protein FA15DRAFT_297058 [Coprinopsis marcescibilis]|uniref:Uncharacterized protein n=1 Tax=Coprinopsis marcescibilis TaxID=230819 RepID=A0A5C3KCV0_COPMA|nr:hypothetical protein FA15DRAFT_297058 [Coprinopsis marcescibilis]